MPANHPVYLLVFIVPNVLMFPPFIFCPIVGVSAIMAFRLDGVADLSL